MNKVKITVLKTTLDRELAAEYGAEGFTACPMLKEGQIFYADYAKPEGFCDEAWKAIYQYVFALAHGAGKPPAGKTVIRIFLGTGMISVMSVLLSLTVYPRG